MIIRAYKIEDNTKLIELLRLNTPKYFESSEELYIIYLDKHTENYFVIEDSQLIIGARGINYGFDNGETVRISWDIIHPNKQNWHNVD